MQQPIIHSTMIVSDLHKLRIRKGGLVPSFFIFLKFIMYVCYRKCGAGEEKERINRKIPLEIIVELGIIKGN